MTSPSEAQQTPGWHAARCGKITASRFRDIITRRKDGKLTAAARAYQLELLVERLTGQPAQQYETVAMRWGADNEEPARQRYAMHRAIATDGADAVTMAPYVSLPEDPRFGCSPDGLVGGQGLVEIKCPFNAGNHIQTLVSGMPPEHLAQVQGQLWVTGRQWVDFVSFDPRMPPGLDLHIERVERDQDYIDGMVAQLQAFADALDTEEQQLREMMA